MKILFQIQTSKEYHEHHLNYIKDEKTFSFLSLLQIKVFFPKEFLSNNKKKAKRDARESNGMMKMEKKRKEN